MKNEWVVGIIGGVISSFIVYWITKYISNRKVDKEYIQKVVSANKDLLNAFRPVVANNIMPTQELLNSLKLAAAKQANVNPDDLYTLQAICNELTLEIMSNPFLDVQRKVSLSKNMPSDTKSNGKTSTIETVESLLFTIQVKRRKLLLKFSLIFSMVSLSGIGIMSRNFAFPKNVGIVEQMISLIVFATMVIIFNIILFIEIRNQDKDDYLIANINLENKGPDNTAGA